MIKRALIILGLSVGLAGAEGPQYGHKDGATQQEFENVYNDLRNVLNRPIASLTVSTMTVSSATITTGTITTLRTTGIVGVTDGSDAAAGNVGAVISAETSSNTNAAATTVWDDLLSIPLPPGDWDVTAGARLNRGNATWEQASIAITATAGNDATGVSYGQNAVIFQHVSSNTTPESMVAVVPMIRISVTSNTTYYLKRLFVYSAGTPLTQQARLRARRWR